MMIQAVLGNPHHPEYGVATIPFPIPHDQYAHCMELLEALEIGDAVKADCKVEKIDSFYTVLERTEMLTVNVEELNYLAKRLDSFDTGEAAQFQAMTHKLELFELKDLINLTSCCQQATVITDFSDLSAVGRDHYMNLHGGSAKTEELDALDGEETARRLIESGSGTITPYGVVYNNGMKLEQVYDGQFFPCYFYEPNAITVAVTAKSEPEDTKHITWLYLPMAQEEIDRALQRAGITDPTEARLWLKDSQLPNEADVLLDMERESITYVGLIKIDGDFYYVRSNGEVVTDCVYWITWTHGLKEAGYYTFDENGKLTGTPKNGIVAEDGVLHYYVNGKLTYAGLIKIGDDYYYVNSKCEVVHDCDYYISWTHDLLPQGKYHFDADGKLTGSLIRQITDAMETEIIPFPGGTMSLGDIERRLRDLEQQFQTLLEKATDDPAAYGSQFKEILDEQTFLKEKRSGILADNNEQAKANQRIMDAAQTLENASLHITEWDESAVRQLVETVKVLSKDEIIVTLKGGIEIRQKIMY